MCQDQKYCLTHQERYDAITQTVEPSFALGALLILMSSAGMEWGH